MTPMGLNLPAWAVSEPQQRQPVTPVGLLAGAGFFPVRFAEKARELGIPVVCVGAAGMADPILEQICDRFVWLHRLSLGTMIRTFQRGGVERWTMAGKFHKHILFQPWRLWRLLPDWQAIRFLCFRKRSDNKDDSLLLGLIAEFRSAGLECVSALDICPELLVRAGTHTRRQLTKREKADIAFGWDLAKKMGELDVGQSVMVRERAVLAVEAIEGTDAAILRAGELCGRSGFVVVKVAKPHQDMRFDVPTIGTTTLQNIAAAGGNVLAIEAGKTIIIDEPAVLQLADKLRITVTAITDPQNLE
ncbi:MAG: UDP-2,3-diacylglucosamine diphosphatase LpxI [Bacteroidales bacterium]|nr:UDP-2,3-diacylglucosamine diphosphatase LpxI [Bacteroidales bacterium]